MIEDIKKETEIFEEYFIFDQYQEFLNNSNKNIFHILPKLYIPLEDYYGQKRKDISVKIKSRTLDKKGILYLPHEDIKIKRPLPNKLYFVACKKNTDLGWIFLLDKKIKNLDLEVDWFITYKDDNEILTYWIKHITQVALMGNNLPLYSLGSLGRNLNYPGYLTTHSFNSACKIFEVNELDRLPSELLLPDEDDSPHFTFENTISISDIHYSNLLTVIKCMKRKKLRRRCK